MSRLKSDYYFLEAMLKELVFLPVLTAETGMLDTNARGNCITHGYRQRHYGEIQLL